MKKIFFSLLLFSSQFLVAQNFPAEEQYQLGNGLRVYLIDFGTLPVTSVNLYVNCGKKNEIPGQQSYSSLAADCIALGNSKFDKSTLDDKMFSLGTSITANTNQDYTTVVSSFVTEKLDEGLDIFSAAVLHPLFPADEIKYEVSQMIDYNNPAKLDITQQVNIFSSLWVHGSSNPLGRYFYKDQLLKITADSLKEFYEFNFTPKNSRLVLCGNFDHSKVKAMIEKYFGEWKADYGEVNGVSFENPSFKKKEYAFIARNDATQAALQWNMAAPAPQSKDALTFKLANNVFNDVLFKEIREKGGKTYGINSSYNDETGAGRLNVVTRVRTNEMTNTIQLYDQTLQHFFEAGITASQLTKAKKAVKNEWLMTAQPADIVSFFNPLIYPNYDARKTFLSRIDELTLEDVNKVIKKYFAPGAYKLMIAGDETQLATQLSQLPALKKFVVADLMANQ